MNVRYHVIDWHYGVGGFTAFDPQTDRWGAGMTRAVALADLDEANAAYLADLEVASPHISPRLQGHRVLLRGRKHGPQWPPGVCAESSLLAWGEALLDGRAQ